MFSWVKSSLTPLFLHDILLPKGVIKILYAILGIAILFVLIIVIVSNSGSGISRDEYEQRQFGKYGEQKASFIIQKVLRDDDFLFSGVEISVGGRRTELDNVIVNKYGVFIIEVKNYIGHIVGNEDDYEWKKVKVTDSGYIYEKTVKNPIKQVKRQIYLLSEYLNSHGVDKRVCNASSRQQPRPQRVYFEYLGRYRQSYSFKGQKPSSPNLRRINKEPFDRKISRPSKKSCINIDK